MDVKKIFNHKVFIFINILILFVLINGIAYSLNIKWDFSKGKVNTLSESTSRVLKKTQISIINRSLY